MQKFLSITLLLLFPVLLHAQRGQNTKPAWKPQHNVTKFLGIPVDGSKWTMIQKLKEKGFIYDSKEDLLEGQFNGEEVGIDIITNNNKVRMIMVLGKINRIEDQIKQKYNNLIRQFRNNKKYKAIKAEEISEKQDLSFDSDVANGKYLALFLQAPWDNEMKMRWVTLMIHKKSYGQYFISIYYDNLFNKANGEDL